MRDVSHCLFMIPGPVIDILNGTALLAMRAIMSKLVELEELGKNFSNKSLTTLFVMGLLTSSLIPIYDILLIS